MKNGNKISSLVRRLRNPCGDRLRKLYNVKTVLFECCACFSNQIHDGDFLPDNIVAGKYDTLVELVWKLIAIFVVILIIFIVIYVFY